MYVFITVPQGTIVIRLTSGGKYISIHVCYFGDSNMCETEAYAVCNRPVVIWRCIHTQHAQM
jgi:hypothetical protein